MKANKVVHLVDLGYFGVPCVYFSWLWGLRVRDYPMVV
jgi:hypothetical protein